MPEVKLDVHNTKEMLVLLFTVGKVVKEAKANDGKINVLDFALAMKLFPKVGPAFDDADKILAEMKDIDSAETQELLAFVGAEVGGLIDQPKLLAQINAGLVAVKALADFVKTL